MSAPGESRRTAGAGALRRADHCGGGLAARGAGVDDSEGAARMREVALEASEPRVEPDQAGDPLRDLRAATGDQLRQLAGRIGAVPRMAPGGDPRGVLQ